MLKFNQDHGSLILNAQITLSERKTSFITLKKYDGGLMKLAGDEVAPICEIGSISIYGKHKTNGAYYVEGLTHSLLSVLGLLWADSFIWVRLRFSHCFSIFV